ncbi:bifunctional aminoglycoside phosphotransferase/ATP-binding protein [Achromobacter xylosoxidans]
MQAQARGPLALRRSLHPGLAPLQACERELALNRRTAPALYLGVRRITRQDDGQLSFDGPGELVDAVVQMRRFADDALLETRVTRDGLSVALADRLAGVIADFHDRAEIAPQVDMPARLMGVIDANAQIFAALPSLPADKTASLDAALRRELARHAPLLRARARAGKVRRCHGDLHLANICLIDGEPTLFDCLEFDVSLSTIDVLYDLAFLLMDLWSRGLAPQANQVLNRYLDRRGDDDGLPLMPAFMGLRAAIRAHVVATQAAAAAGPERARLQAQALRYLDTGLACLEPRAAWLVAVGGLSGSGKSVLAAAIAPAIGAPPGARVLSSDRIRKAWHGVGAQAPLPARAYRPEVSEQVYAAQAQRAHALLAAGCCVIADAVFERPADRERIAQAAARARVEFAGFWLQAPPATLVARVKARENDPSDADEAVVRRQLARSPATSPWLAVDAGGAAQATARYVLARLAADGADRGAAAP